MIKIGKPRPKEHYYTLGESIRYYRKRLGIKSKDLANKLHVSESLIYKWEENEKTPHEGLDELCKYLHIQKEDLFYKEKDVLKKITGKLTYDNVENSGCFYFGMASLSLFLIALVMIIISNAYYYDILSLENELSVGERTSLILGVRTILNVSYIFLLASVLLIIIAIVVDVRRIKKLKKKKRDNL